MVKPVQGMIIRLRKTIGIGVGIIGERWGSVIVARVAATVER